MNSIKTIRELKPYIGKFIVSENIISHSKWMQQLIGIDETLLDDDSIEGVELWGNFVTEINPLLYCYGIKNRMSNAQNIIREPTKEEYKKYVAFWTKCKFLGYIPLTAHNKKIWIKEVETIYNGR